MAEKPATGRNWSGDLRAGFARLREAEVLLRRRQAVSVDAAAAWFVREIVPLEAKLMHYLQHNWRNASDIPDLRQEVYARVLASARQQIPDNPEHFLFVCARNLLIDLVRREQVVPMETFADLDVLGLASDAPSPDREVMERDELRRLEAALDRLPPRTREAIKLAYFEGLSRTEIARRMGVTHRGASQFIARGTVALADIVSHASEDEGDDKS